MTWNERLRIQAHCAQVRAESVGIAMIDPDVTRSSGDGGVYQALPVSMIGK